MSVEEDFPIGCEVELIVSADGLPPTGTKGIVIKRSCLGILQIGWYLGGCTITSQGEWFSSDRFRRVSADVSAVVPDPAFCSCESPNVISNSVLGKPFLYCRNCGKERKL